VSGANPPETRLALEIAAQFRRLPPEDAAPAIAKHIRTFWDPRMRARLADQVRGAGAGADALLVLAVAILDVPVT